MMPRHVLRVPTHAVAAAILAAIPIAAQAPVAQYDSVYIAWDAGDYVAALEALDRVLAGPGAVELLAEAAVLTGERYRTVEVAVDGANPRWSPDGAHAAYDIPGDAPRTAVVSVRDGGVHPVAELPGYRAAFSPDGRRVAFLQVADPAALAREQTEIRERVPVRTRADFLRLRDELEAAQARHSRVRARDLVTGAERDIAAPGLAVHEIEWSGSSAFLWAIAAPAGGVPGLYAIGMPDGPRRGADAGHAARNLRMSPTGTHLVHDDADGLRLVVLGAGASTHYRAASSPTFAADGSALAFVARDGDEFLLQRVRLGPGDAASGSRLDPQTLLRTSDRLAAPALSADGGRVAFQRMERADWEVWIVAADEGDGEGEAGHGEPRRLTHDIQHDVLPTWVAGDRLLVIKGEARHRRSYLYPERAGGDPAVREWVPGLGEGMRLFHNNTIRTVAPEYAWAVSPDGMMVLIVAERDGDTISPERGIYLTDLSRPVTIAEVRARVADQLAAERELRDRGYRLFEPVAEEVRGAVADVSITRIYRHAAELYRFGSKFITQPGNAKAIAYLDATLRGFGYEPELQWFEPRPGVRTANVIARLPGTVRPELVYMVSSHFDSVERGPGADDNSSGTTALLEVARVMAARPQAATIEFAFFTGEEAGLLGSREFTRRALAEGRNVVGVLNNDMIGYSNDHRLDNTIRYSNPAIRDLQHAAAFLFTDLILYDARYYRSTDAHALYDAFGDVIGGIGSYPILANPHYHQEHDVLETINHRLVAEVAKATVAAILRMAAEP
jgi:hypothetical protein